MLNECTKARLFPDCCVQESIGKGLNLKFPSWEVANVVPSLGEDRRRLKRQQGTCSPRALTPPNSSDFGTAMQHQPTEFQARRDHFKVLRQDVEWPSAESSHPPASLGPSLEPCLTSCPCRAPQPHMPEEQALFHMGPGLMAHPEAPRC